MLEVISNNFQHFQHAGIIKYMIIMIFPVFSVLEVFSRVGKIHAKMQATEG
jgi:hypothetical protein